MRRLNLKFIILLAALLLFSSELFSQSGYVFVGGGYHIGYPSFYMGRDVKQNSGSVFEYTGEYGSWAEGVQAAGGFGVYLNKDMNFAFEVEGSYLVLPSEHIFTDESDVTGITKSTEYEITYITVQPGFKALWPMKSMVPYISAGAVIGFPSFTTIYTDNIRERKDEITGGMALGMSGALGLNYKIDKALSILFEINYTSVTWQPAQRETVLYEENGVDRLHTLVNTKVDYQAEYSSSESNVEQQPTYPFSAAGVILGVQYAF